MEVMEELEVSEDIEVLVDIEVLEGTEDMEVMEYTMEDIILIKYTHTAMKMGAITIDILKLLYFNTSKLNYFS